MTIFALTVTSMTLFVLESHASFFTIELPPYSSKEVMYERLNYAISSCSSIDSDGLFNNNV